MSVPKHCLSKGCKNPIVDRRTQYTKDNQSPPTFHVGNVKRMMLNFGSLASCDRLVIALRREMNTHPVWNNVLVRLPLPQNPAP